MDVSRDFKVKPPREELNNLRAIVDDFHWRFPRDRRDTVTLYCAKADNVFEAVDRACASRAENGKMHNHQTRVPAIAREKLAEVLKDTFKTMGTPVSFHQLLGECEETGIAGIGPVTAYDVATRIGAYLGLEPDRVYLHAGVRIGWKALIECSMFPDGVGENRKRRYLKHARSDAYILPGLLPEEFVEQKADDLEDILCTYSQHFTKHRVSATW